jgi:predicted Zn-dependent protease
MTKVDQPRTRRRTVLALATLGVAIAVGVALFRDRRSPQEIWTEAQRALTAGQFDRAEAGLARLTRLRPHTPEDWMLRAQVAIARNRPDDAIDAFSQIRQGHPLAAQARLKAGQVELRRDRARSAEGFLLDTLRLDPGLVQARRELIYIYGMQLRRAELNEQFTRLSERAPLTFENVWHWCLLRNMVWEPVEVSEILARFLKADPGDRWSRLALAENLRLLGRRAEAAQALAALGEDDPEARALRVKLALDRGEDQAAEALLSGGPADHPGLALLRGQSALAHGDGPAAVQHFRLAFDADPADRDAVDGLAKALTLVGDHEAAAPLLARSRNFDTLSTLMGSTSGPASKNDPKLIRRLGAACEAVQRLPEARAWFRLALDFDPLDEDTQRSLHRLTPKPPSG